MWLIASIPFWIAGLIFLRGSVRLLMWPSDAVIKDAQGAMIGLVLAGTMFLIGAKVAS